MSSRQQLPRTEEKMPVVRNGAQDEDEGHLMMIGKMQQWSLSDPRGGLGWAGFGY